MPAIRNRVLLVLVAVTAAAMAFGGLVSHARNRLVSGQPLMLWQAVGRTLTVPIVLIIFGLLVAAFLRGGKARDWLVVGLASLLLVFGLVAAGQAALVLATTGSPVARTSLGAAAWVGSVCAALMIVDALQRLKASTASCVAVVAVIAGAVVLIGSRGAFDALSLVQEYRHRQSAFTQELGQHCLLATAAIVPAILIGIPLGIAVARRPSWRGPMFSTLNLVQTIPSVALFGLLIGPLSALGTAVPGLGVSGIGFPPAAIALVLYALLPMVRNTYAGITGIDPAVIETATGMGFTRGQILRHVELPLALPILLAGVRIVTVQAIGLAVVAALVGAGGLGTFVFQGLGQYAADLVLLGAVPAILLALIADFGLRGLAAMFRRGAGA